jgi:hypothetical protein
MIIPTTWLYDWGGNAGQGVGVLTLLLRRQDAIAAADIITEYIFVFSLAVEFLTSYG